MLDSILDALNDSLRTVPLLLVIYIGIELLEFKFGDRIRQTVQKAGRSGPLIGAIAGAFPQCGFSVIATALFTQRLVTMGTLLAVYLSTSDEAIPIILSQPDKVHLIFPLITFKIFIAIIAGYIIDLIFNKEQSKVLTHLELVEEGHDSKSHHHETVINETACCGHSTSCTSKKFSLKEIVWHPILHTLNVFLFIFITTLVLNLVIYKMGITAFDSLFTQSSLWQPFFTALIGLIPNCAASVAITELYLRNAINLGPAISGLCASGGLGLLVLYREECNKKLFIKIIVILYTVSVIAGLLIQYFF